MRRTARLLTRSLCLAVAAGCSGSASTSLAGCRGGQSAPAAIAACTRVINAAGLTDSVRVLALLERGKALRETGKYQESLEDYHRVIALQPGLASAYNSEGLTWLLAGSADSALWSFNQALARDPANVQALKNRGRTYFYLGRFVEAATDLERGSAADSMNLYVAIWWYLAHARADAQDRSLLRTVMARNDTLVWPAPIAEFLLDHLPAKELLLRASAVPDSLGDQRCAVSFYLGEISLIRGDTALAVPQLQHARGTCPAAWTEHLAARAELQRITP